MSYTAAIHELNAMVPELHTGAGEPRRKFSLDEIRVLLEALGSPQRSFPSVLIGGTNGKGSTAATLASILTASGLRVGLYTSPHLERANERIRVDGAEIGDSDFARHYFRVHDAARELVKSGRLPQMPSYFEVLTALAFLHFAESGIGIAVLEVGMGGRLDATNVVEPVVSVITDISLDHMEWLGSTITEITREKSGILRAGGAMVTLPQHPEANQVLGEVATELGVRGISSSSYVPAPDVVGAYALEVLGTQILVDSPLMGAHQHRNVALAIATAVELASGQGVAVTAGSIEAGIAATRWPGRMERVSQGGVEWILDVAHNPAGAWALRAGLRGMAQESAPRTLIFSCLRDKPVAEMAQILFPLFERVILAPIHSARAAALADLRAAAEKTGTPALVAESVDRALELARESSQGEMVVVSGSVYLVGEVRTRLLGAQGDGA